MILFRDIPHVYVVAYIFKLSQTNAYILDMFYRYWMALIVHKKDLEEMEKAKFGCSLPDKVRVRMRINKKLSSESKANVKDTPLEVDSEKESMKKVVKGPVTYFGVNEWADIGEECFPRARRPRFPYLHGWKFCRLCDQYILTDDINCPIHNIRLRTNPRSGSREAVRYSLADRVSLDEEKVDKIDMSIFVKRANNDMISVMHPYEQRKKNILKKIRKETLRDIGVWL